jgi:hypothetical protein
VQRLSPLTPLEWQVIYTFAIQSSGEVNPEKPTYPPELQQLTVLGARLLDHTALANISFS